MAEQTPDQLARNQLREYRQVVADVIGELRAQEVRDTYAAITLVELAAQHVKNLSNPAGKPGRLERITKIRDAYLSKIEGLKNTPAQAFRTPDPSSDVNTAP
jgi:hypothetical protein